MNIYNKKIRLKLQKETNSMQKVLITGGAGFIGSHLTNKILNSGYKVVIIDRLNDKSSKIKKIRLKKILENKKCKFHNLELSSTNKLTDIFRQSKIDAICHLAAKTDLNPDTELYNKTNILGTINIFELAKNLNIPKIVFASSSMVYGNNKKQPFCETDNTDHPLSVYAANKKTDEVLAYTYHHLYGIKMIGLRFFSTYGPLGRPDMAISKFTELIVNNKPISIHNFGKIKKDFTYIDDTVSGIVSSLETDLDYEIINLGSGQSSEIEKIVCLIEKYLDKKAIKNYIPMIEGDLPETCADISKAEKLLNYNPKINIEKGIEKFVQWYKKYNNL